MWQLEQTLGQLTVADLRAAVDVRDPRQGIHNVVLAKHTLVGQFLGVQLPPATVVGDERVTDCYVRNDDLVATYAETPSRSVRPQIYWRAITHGAAARGVEVIVSVQTNLLDSRPVISTATELVATDVRQLASLADERFESIASSKIPGSKESSHGPAAFLFRFADPTLAYLEMAFPADYGGASLDFAQAGATTRLSFSLLRERFEKGVIRCARVRGLFLTGGDLEAVALRCYREFLAAPLPLTT